VEDYMKRPPICPKILAMSYNTLAQNEQNIYFVRIEKSPFS
jgi:hypothetical protein